MKTLKKINLLNLSQTELTNKEKGMLKGGGYVICVCRKNCGCKYAGDKEGADDSFYGGSSVDDNSDANGKILSESAMI